MKIEAITNMKKPIYAVGAAMLASAVLFSACAEKPYQTEEFVLEGEGQLVEDYTDPTTTTSESETAVVEETLNTVILPEDYDSFCAEAFNENFCSADAALEWAIDNDVVVFENLSCTSGKDVWNTFYLTAEEGNPASVLCAFYYTLDEDSVSEELYEEEKDNYPVLYFYLVTYDETYNIKVRDSSQHEIDYEYDGFLYLNHYNGENPEGSEDRFYNAYVLTDYEHITWDDISHGIYGSDKMGYVEHITVYHDLFD